MSGMRTTLSCIAAALAVSAWLPTAQAEAIKVALLTQPGIWDAGVFAAVDKKFFEHIVIPGMYDGMDRG